MLRRITALTLLLAACASLIGCARSGSPPPPGGASAPPGGSQPPGGPSPARPGGPSPAPPAGDAGGAPATQGQTLEMYDAAAAAKGTPLRTWRLKEPVREVLVSPDLRWGVALIPTPTVGMYDQMRLVGIDLKDGSTRDIEFPPQPVFHVNWLPDGRLLVVSLAAWIGEADGTGLKAIEQFPEEAGWRASVSPSGRYLAHAVPGADGESYGVGVVDLVTRQTREFKNRFTPRTGDGITAFAWAPAEDVVAVEHAPEGGQTPETRLIDLRDGAIRGVIRGGAAPLWAPSPDLLVHSVRTATGSGSPERRLARTSADGSILRGGLELAPHEYVRGLSSGGRDVLLVRDDGTDIRFRLADLQTGARRPLAPGHWRLTQDGRLLRLTPAGP